MKALRNAALEYADLGWSVLPLRTRGKAPLGQLVRRGKDDSTADLVTVLRWWRECPAANVGLNCHASGFVAIDVDPRHGGDDTLHDLERELGRLPDTVRAMSGGGGEHHLYRHPGGDLVGQLGDGLDVKDHGYIVAPPSIHPCGQGYEWDIAPGEVELAELPEVWLARMRPAFARRREGVELRVDHADPLRRVPAASYVERLTGEPVDARGFARCPFHGGGTERTPSLKTDGTVWACYACQPIAGRRVMGGDIYDFAALLKGFAIPLRGLDFQEVQGLLHREVTP